MVPFEITILDKYIFAYYTFTRVIHITVLPNLDR
jgi:hypothetical protein